MMDRYIIVSSIFLLLGLPAFGQFNTAMFFKKAAAVSEIDAIIAKADELGYTKPSVAVLGHMETLINNLKDAGLWDDFDVLYCFEHDGSEEFSRINWINPDQFLLTEVGNVTWTSSVGVTSGSGTNTNYYNTGWDYPTNASKISQNNASVGIVLEPGIWWEVGTEVSPIDVARVFKIGRRAEDGRLTIRITTGTTSSVSGDNYESTGNCQMVTVYRSSSSSYSRQINANTPNSSLVASATPIDTQDVFLLRESDSTPSDRLHLKSMKFAFWGNANLTGTNLFTLFNTYSGNVEP